VSTELRIVVPEKGMSMRKLVSLLSVIALVAVVSVGTASADDKKGGGAPPPAAGGGNGKVKVYDFSGDTIEGDLVKPEGSVVDATQFAKHSSLIRIRKDFIPEIIKSAEDL
jgi:hypothetical protein